MCPTLERRTFLPVHDFKRRQNQFLLIGNFNQTSKLHLRHWSIYHYRYQSHNLSCKNCAFQSIFPYLTSVWFIWKLCHPHYLERTRLQNIRTWRLKNSLKANYLLSEKIQVAKQNVRNVIRVPHSSDISKNNV